LFNKCFLTVRIPQNLPPKSRKWHLRDSRFKNFPGENAPGTPYDARAYSARLFPFSRAREYSLLRRLVLAFCLRQSHLAHVSLAGRTFLAGNILVKIAAQNLWRAKHELSSMGGICINILKFFIMLFMYYDIKMRSKKPCHYRLFLLNLMLVTDRQARYVYYNIYL
jgi:hypothetical protein